MDRQRTIPTAGIDFTHYLTHYISLLLALLLLAGCAVTAEHGNSRKSAQGTLKAEKYKANYTREQKHFPLSFAILPRLRRGRMLSPANFCAHGYNRNE